MKKLSLSIALLSVLAVLLFTISSCTKKSENNAPVVVIDEPTDGAITTLPDSTHVEGTATDDEELHELSVIIKNHMGDTVLAQYPMVHALPTYSFHYHFATSDTGMYHLQVTASDHDGGLTSKEVMFFVKQ